MNLNSARIQNLDWSQSENSNRSRSLDRGQSLNLNLKVKRHVFHVFSLEDSSCFCCRRGFARCLEQPVDRWGFGKMICVKP
jgi:hypothetical protein